MKKYQEGRNTSKCLLEDFSGSDKQGACEIVRETYECRCNERLKLKVKELYGADKQGTIVREIYQCRSNEKLKLK